MKETTPTHEEWLKLWQSALNLATCKAIPLDILDDYTRSRLTVFLCCEALESGRRERKKKKCHRGRRQQVAQNVSTTSAKLSSPNTNC